MSKGSGKLGSGLLQFIRKIQSDLGLVYTDPSNYWQKLGEKWFKRPTFLKIIMLCVFKPALHQATQLMLS